MTLEKLETLAKHVSLHIQGFSMEPVEKKPNYHLKYADLYLLESRFSSLIEIPARTVAIVDEVFIQLLEEGGILYDEVGGSNPLFRPGFKIILTEVRYKLFCIVRDRQKLLDGYASLAGPVSLITDDNLHPIYASHFRKMIYQNLLAEIRERMIQIEYYRALELKVENHYQDKF